MHQYLYGCGGTHRGVAAFIGDHVGFDGMEMRAAVRIAFSPGARDAEYGGAGREKCIDNGGAESTARARNQNRHVLRPLAYLLCGGLFLAEAGFAGASSFSISARIFAVCFARSSVKYSESFPVCCATTMPERSTNAIQGT